MTDGPSDQDPGPGRVAPLGCFRIATWADGPQLSRPAAVSAANLTSGPDPHERRQDSRGSGAPAAYRQFSLDCSPLAV